MNDDVTQPLLRRWMQFWLQLQLTADGLALGQQLLQAWAEPQRAYHTQEHLLECLTLFDQVRTQAETPLAIEAALWFHDAIYDPRATDNEARSAAWAVAALTAAGVDTALISTVDRLIMATCHNAAPDSPDAALLIDIDLAILGADRARFDRYDSDVRREYAHVSALAYRLGRGRILGQFLARPSIYSTPGFRAAREALARGNLRRARRRLLIPLPLN